MVENFDSNDEVDPKFKKIFSTTTYVDIAVF